MKSNISTEGIVANTLINLPKELSEDNKDIIEKAGDVRDAIELKLNFLTNPIDALKKHLEHTECDERKLNVENLIEGLKSDISKEKALELTSAYIDSYLNEELAELTEEASEMNATVKKYNEVIKNNFNFVDNREQLKEVANRLSDLSLPRKEYITNVLNSIIATLSSNVDLTKQLTNREVLSKAISAVNRININLNNTLDILDRYKNDIITVSVKDMIKQDLPSEDVAAMVNIEPYEPITPNDSDIDLYEELSKINEEEASIDMYIGYFTLIEVILSKLDSLQYEIKELDKIDYTIVNKILKNLGEFIKEEVNDNLNKNKAKNLIYLLQYIINNTTFVYNSITTTYVKINKDLKILTGISNLCLIVANRSTKSETVFN